MNDYAQSMEAVALRLLGKPASKTRNEIRYGRRGSLSVDLKKGTWFDHEAAIGGGVIDLIREQTGLAGSAAAEWLRDHVRVDLPDASRHRPERIERPVDTQKVERDRRFIRTVLGEAVPIENTLAEKYLQWRGCIMPPSPSAVFFHPSVRHPSGSTVAAMVSPITRLLDGEQIIGLHLTALTATGEGKSDTSPRKWMRGTKTGGVVRLVDDADVVHGIGLAEGIETALAVIGAGWSPVWAALDAGNLASLPPLPPLTLTVFADRDEAGMRAAAKAVAAWRMAGLEAQTAAPPSGDWADGGADG